MAAVQNVRLYCRASRRGFAVLSHTWAGGQAPEAGSPQRLAVLLHGILGSKANWNTPARRLLQRVGPSGWRVLQLDHRSHGKSPIGLSPHTLEACADDVLETLQSLGVEKDAEVVLCGHSFGGKVALAVAQALFQVGTPPRMTWTLDSVPGDFVEFPLEAQKAEQSVQFVLGVVEEVAGNCRTFPDRAKLIAALEAEYGLRPALGQWVAQSSRASASGDGSVELLYDARVIRQLFDAMRGTSMWHVLEADNFPTGVVVAGRNRHSWGTDNLERLAGCGAHVQKVTLENAGHNVHVDDLPGLLDILVPSFED